MTETPWGWKVTIDTLETLELTRSVDEEPSKITISFTAGLPVMRAEGPFCELTAVEFAMKRWESAERKPRYLQLLDEWAANGTLDRIKRATEERTHVRIKRSSGAWQTCVITSCAGHGGLTTAVEWDDPDSPGQKLAKSVKTERLIEWNPWLGSERSA